MNLIANFYTDEERRYNEAALSQPYVGRVTPSQVVVLAAGEIFVFGSNAAGQHGGGAARLAAQRFGAVWGTGEGLQGQSYALPTMEGLTNTRLAVDRFIIFAQQHPELTFLVTAVGCGIAGYKPTDIAPMFKNAINAPNVRLPLDFWKILLNIH